MATADTLGVLRKATGIVLLAILAVTLWRGWIAPAGDSFWLDECGTAWLIDGGWGDVWERTAFHPNSRAYGLLMRAWSQVFGKSEWSLRLPSILFVAGAAACIAAILKRAKGVGWPVFVFVAMSPELQFSGLDARPYALAFFAYSLASYALLRFDEEEQTRWGLVWAVAAGVTFWANAVVGAALSAHVVWILVAGRRRWLRWIPYAFLAAGLVAFEVWRLRPSLAHPTHHAFQFTLDILRLPRALFPLSILVPGAVASLGLWRARREPLDFRLLALALLTIVLPATLTFLQSARSGVDLMLNRYLVVVWWGWMLLLGLVAARWLEPGRRLAVVTLFAAVTLAGSLYKTGWRIPHAESDWRGALAAARTWDAGRGRPILIHTGFIEGGFPLWLEDPKRSTFLKAPVYAYPYPGPSHVLPYRFDATRLPRVEPPYAMVVYEDTQETSKYVPALAPDARPVGRFLRLRVYAVER